MLTRREIYKKIKDYGLEAEIKIKFGDNYTRIPSVDLCRLIEKYQDLEKECCNCKKSTAKTINDVNIDEITDPGLRRAFVKLVATLQTSKTLYPEEVEDILKEL